MSKRILAGHVSALALGLLLAGCGGGDSGGVASTPPPTASYTKIVDMSGNRTFQTTGVTYDVGTSINNGSSNLYGSGVTVGYTQSSDSYTITAPGGVSQTFGPADVQPSNPAAPTVVQYMKVAGTTRDVLTLIAPRTTGGVALSYTVIGTWGTVDTVTSVGTYRVAIGGSPTLTSDMPKTGSATYSAGVGGTGVLSGTPYMLSGNSSGSFSANFGTGSLTTSLTLAGTPLAGGSSVTSFGTYSGTGSLGSGGPGFSGTLTGTAANGLFSGLFLGPQALEVAYAYYLNGATFSAAGTLTGIKQ